MCWLPLLLGALMIAPGIFLIVRFFRGRGTTRPEIAGAGRTETMILGVLLASLGSLLFYLGLSGVICRGLGLA